MVENGEGIDTITEYFTNFIHENALTGIWERKKNSKLEKYRKTKEMV